MTEQSKDQIHQAEDKLNLSIGIECIKPAPDEIKNTKDVQPEIDEVKHEVPTEKNEGVSIIIQQLY